MISLYKYIFCRIYYFYVKIFKEKEIPHYFATAVISVILMSNIVIIIDGVFYVKNPDVIHLYSGYFKYFVLILLFSLLFFIKSKNRYQHILEHDAKIGVKKKRILAVISVLYILALVICFSYQGELIRDYHIENLHLIE